MLAGLTVGLTAIPQGIAYAVVAGLEPQVSPAQMASSFDFNSIFIATLFLAVWSLFRVHGMLCVFLLG